MRALFAKKGTKSLAKSYFGSLEFFFEIAEKAFDIQLNPEFTGVVTDLPNMDWIEIVEFVCELCYLKRIERVLPL